MHTFARLVAGFLLLAVESASACDVVQLPPTIRFKSSDAVVLAVPKAISFLPREARRRTYAGAFRQTILWEVLISWKGTHKAGTTFTTRQNFTENRGCGSGNPIASYERDVQLLYLSGQEPYFHFGSHDPSDSADDFRFLEAIPRTKGNGT